MNEAGRYYFDLEALAAGVTGRESMLIFCSPHNPGGRVWSAEEQRAVAEFCNAHGLVLVCDEIHHDLIYAPARHIPMPLLARRKPGW
ncbi:MAG: aminotransferase class I/II-fold pyridoxal phosphate-dependent enzyme [Thiolinea sp.]